MAGARTGSRRKLTARLSIVVLTAALAGFAGSRPAAATVDWASSVTASDGTVFTVTNHLTPAAFGPGREWLLAWAGPADPTSPDFMAVIDATKNSPTYGEVVNTLTVGPGLGSEPHHMQYVWHKGDSIFAGGLLSDTTLVLDSSRLPALSLRGVNIASDTPCGSAPDAYWTLKDGSAYATYMGGPNVAGPCTYTNGEVRVGNGFAGSPGEIVHIGADGRTLAEIPAASAASEDPQQCGSVPQLAVATCANPHGIAVREDLNRIVASDFLEPRDFLSPQAAPEERLTRNTVRTFDISDRSNVKLASIGTLPIGPRAALENDPFWDESRVVMETATTHLPHNKGAFAATMNGGAVHYTPDITAANPKWREVYDDTAAYRTFQPDRSVRGGGDNASWIFVSPDDRFLFHAVMGQSVPYGAPLDRTTGMVYVLDIRKMLAAGTKYKCSIDKLSEVFHGGAERDCPSLVDVLPIRDVTSGGPHWGTIDNFDRRADGTYRETKTAERMAIANYFLANSFGGDGDHRVCMVTVGRGGHLDVDNTFRDEHTGQPCVSFNRADWPHGTHGDSRPHGVLFAVSDRPLRR
ncbi:hypothetical protein [Actinoplanes sp. NPDC049118]|uniref:hypothetical protein n=1 Tax=Actinoplanes sp. NPDC049118 TaxID=3155769 RepID=UPI0033C441B6